MFKKLKVMGLSLILSVGVFGCSKTDTKVGNDTFKPVLSARASVCAQAHTSGGKTDIVGDNENMIGRDFIEGGSLRHRLPGVVHKGHWLEKERLLISDHGFRCQRMVFHAIDMQTKTLRYGIHG